MSCRVPSFYFDKTSTRSQRNKSSSRTGHNQGNDIMYDIENNISDHRKIQMSIRRTGRGDKMSGNRLLDSQMNTNNLSYNVEWSTQEKKTHGFIDIARSLPSKGLNKKVFLKPTGGTIGCAYEDPAMKYIPGPFIKKQISRCQRNRVGYVVSDWQSVEWNSQQHPLNVKYQLTDKRRTDKFATFAKLVPKVSFKNPTDLSFANSECTSQIDISFNATKRPISRSIRLGPGLRTR